MSELKGKEREATLIYFWSKVRQALKEGECGIAWQWMLKANKEEFGFADEMAIRVTKTFTAGCIALGDPAQLDKENDHE